MKVLFIEPCFENFGGYFRAVGLAKSLARKGLKIDLLCPSKESFSFRIKKKILEKNLVRWELPRWEIHFFINGRFARGIISSLFVLFRKYDLIHVFASAQIESVIPFWVAKLLGKRIIFDWDDYWQGSPLFENSGALVRRYLSFLENMIPKYSKYMTVTSTFLKKEAEKLGAKEVLKVINGVDLSQFAPVGRLKARKRLGIGLQEKMILSFGNTYGGKRAFLLLKTFSEILKLDPTVKLYFRFKPELFLEDKRIKKQIDPSVFKNLIVTGFIKDELLPFYLGAADVMLFLMGNSSGEKACFPIRVGTYLNGGKVIATNKTETEMCFTLAEFDCALIGNNPSGVAWEVIKFFKDEKFRKKKKTNALKAKEDLSWDNLVVKLMKFYDVLEK